MFATLPLRLVGSMVREVAEMHGAELAVKAAVLQGFEDIVGEEAAAVACCCLLTAVWDLSRWKLAGSVAGVLHAGLTTQHAQTAVNACRRPAGSRPA